jgi:hypothetical protein
MTKNKISKSVSTGLLRSLKSLIKVGNSVPNALGVLIQVEKGRSKKILEKIHYNIVQNDTSIGKALELEGVIDGSEVFIIDNSPNSIEAIDAILSIRELGGNFEKTMLKLFAFPVLAVILGLTIAYMAQPTFSDMVLSLAEQVKVTKGIDVSEQAKLMWYLESRTITMQFLQIYITFWVIFIVSYFYYLEYKPNVIYKVFGLKAYDDVPFILMLMHNLQRAGLDQVRIFEMLKNSSPKKGWVSLFGLLEIEARAGRPIYTIFESYSFPKDVVLVLKSAEVSKTFWDNIGGLVEYVKDTNTNKHKMLNSMLGGLGSIGGFMIILYFVSGLFMAMFSLQSLAMSLM